MLVEASQAENSHIVSFCLTAITGNIQRLWRDSVMFRRLNYYPRCRSPESARGNPRLVAKADEGYDVVGTVRQNRRTAGFVKRHRR